MSSSAEEAPFRDREPIANAAAEQVLGSGEIEILGQMPWSSNATLLCDVTDGETIVQAIYKPHQGERPLWDFPSGLFKREVACYELAKDLSWDLVPPTVLVDGPVGPGSLQLFIPCDFEHHYLTMHEEPKHQDTFMRLAVFDVVANSTDRKSGHVLLGKDGRIWAIDNGLSFHEEFKLRTVVWDYAGDPIPDDIRSELNDWVVAGPSASLTDLLDDQDEVEAMLDRAGILLRSGHFPTDPSGRRWPWPIV